MAEVAIVDASPLIFLARASRLDLLRMAADTILVPESVVAEVQAHADDAAGRLLQRISWLTVAPSETAPAPILAWHLGAGETAVLACALARPGAEAVLDDLAGRRCAAALGIPVRGTLGLVLTARQRGSIPAARPVVEALRREGMYLSDRVLDAALALVGE